MKSTTPSAELDTTEKDAWSLAGELTFASVPELWQEGKRLFATKIPKNITLDLAKVVRTDSAGLALMVDWLRRAKNRNVAIRFQNIPKQMISMAKTTEVDLLFVENSGPIEVETKETTSETSPRTDK